MNNQQQQQQLESLLAETICQQNAWNAIVTELQAELTEHQKYACKQAAQTSKLHDKVVYMHAEQEKLCKQNYRQSRQL